MALNTNFFLKKIERRDNNIKKITLFYSWNLGKNLKK